MPRGWFTPRSARLAADRLEPLARCVRREYRRLQTLAPTPAAEGPVEPGYFAAVCRFHRATERLAGEGVLVRDPARGWFEFPARRAGRTVLLSLRLGEAVPSGWAERGESHGARRVDEDGPWEPPEGSS